MRIFHLFFILSFLSASLEAKQEEGHSIYNYCKQQGYKIGTVEFEDCCLARKEKEYKKDQEQAEKKQILGRDFAGRRDETRVRREELDLIPKRDPIDASYPPGTRPIQ
jgi:hypothetical protein